MRPLAKTLGCSLLLLALGSCANDEKSPDLDKMRLDAGRLNMLIDRSNDGLDLQPGRVQVSADPDALKRLIIDSSLREAGLKLQLLRNRLMNEDILSERDARAKTWPAWIGQPPESTLSPDDLQERIDWLRTEVEELTKFGCEVGRQKSGQAKYCSVE